VNTEIQIGENNFCESESNFTHDGNIVVSINLLCAFVDKKTLIANIVVVTYLCLKNHRKRRGIVSNLVVESYKCNHAVGMMTSNNTRSRLCDNNILLVIGLR
jgi:hypothetical protein